MLAWDHPQLKADNVTLEWLMTNAFHARSDQISHEPNWAKDKRFDITAKLTDIDEASLKKMTPEQHRALLLALLAERFGLKYHVETKEMPIYDLVSSKNGLKLAPAATSAGKSKQTDDSCDGCWSWGNNSIKGRNVDVQAFMEMLADQLGRDVHNGTGYTGKLDVNLKWAPDVGSTALSDEDAGLPPLPKALESQMGLRLVSGRGAVKLYVIDHLNEPSAN